jgi:hypothetical protein
MNSLTSSISKMMQRPQPPPVPVKTDTAGQSDSSQTVVDSDGGTPEGDLASMQPSTSYASRVPTQQTHGQTRNTAGSGDGIASGITSVKTTGPTILRRPTLLRGNSGPDAPEGGATAGAAAGQARATARTVGQAGAATAAQGQVPGMAGMDESVDGLGAMPKTKVRFPVCPSSVRYSWTFSLNVRSHSNSTFTTKTHPTSYRNSLNSSLTRKCRTC